MLDSFMVTSFTQVPGMQQSSLRRRSAWHILGIHFPAGRSHQHLVPVSFEYVDLLRGEGFSSFGFVVFSGTNWHYHSKMGIPHPEPCTCCIEGHVGGARREWSGWGGVLLAATSMDMSLSNPFLWVLFFRLTVRRYSLPWFLNFLLQ